MSCPAIERTGPKAAPIVYLPGGPSFPGISSYALDEYFAGAPYAADRDLILVDTRGVGSSKPYLGCPEIDRAAVGAFYSRPTLNSQASTLFSQALVDCRARLVNDGIDPAAYTLAESAADLEDLRLALGIHEWNLVAVSADGQLGLTYMRLHPAGIRSAIIDSGMSTQLDYGLDWDRGQVVELESIFAGCAADPGCSATYPNIGQRFHRLVDQLNQRPVAITFPDFQPRPTELSLDGAGLLADSIAQIFPGDRSFPETIHDLLAVIWRQTHGELTETYREFFGTGPVEDDHPNDVLAMGKTLSFVCHDSAGFLRPADLRRATHDIPAYAPRYLGPDYDLQDGFSNPVSPAGCRVWDVGLAPPVQHRAVKSSIPTLVLAGEYDTAIPPNVVSQVDDGLERSYFFEFPAGAHLQLASYNHASDCARTIATAFLDEPTTRPDSSCVAELPPFDFGDLRPENDAGALGQRGPAVVCPEAAVEPRRPPTLVGRSPSLDCP